MSAQALLDRLDRVQEKGPDRWVACCPAHDDKSPSLSIRDADGRTLIHCFGGCSAGDVMAAVGLSVSDLFDKPLEHSVRGTTARAHNHAALEALRTLRGTTIRLAILTREIASTGKCSRKDAAFIQRAHAKIEEVLKVIDGN